MADRTRRITIKDVAEEAGVSRSTTSRALTGNGYVAPDVRNRVQAAAKKLGYVPDLMARNLKQQRSNLIGVLVSDLRNAFYSHLAAGISHRARELGYGVILSDSSADAFQAQDAASRMASMRVAGVILTPVTSQVSDDLLRLGIPFVEVDRYFTPDRADSVVVANERGAREATGHLLELGHRRIALFIDETDWTTGRERESGFRAAFFERGLSPDPEMVFHSGWNAEDARAAARELLSGPDRPTALFAANNVLAEGAWRAADDVGLRIPEDLSLIAFDDSPWMSMVTPPVTAVEQDSFGLGRVAATRLFDRLDQPAEPFRSVVLGTTLLSRGSTAAPPG